MAFISDSIARMLFGARHEETTSKTVASAGRASHHSLPVSDMTRVVSIRGRKFIELNTQGGITSIPDG